MEMSQVGFSAAYDSEVPKFNMSCTMQLKAPSSHFLSDLKGFLMGAVGANQWKGGFLKYNTRNKQRSLFEPSDMDPDSYLGVFERHHK